MRGIGEDGGREEDRRVICSVDVYRIHEILLTTKLSTYGQNTSDSLASIEILVAINNDRRMPDAFNVPSQ